MESRAGGGRRTDCLIIIALAVFLAALLAGPVHAYAGYLDLSQFNLSQYSRVIYVDAVNGNDVSGDGSELMPYRTIPKAVTGAIDNTLIVTSSEGTYSIPNGLQSILATDKAITYGVPVNLRGQVRFDLGKTEANRTIVMNRLNTFIGVVFQLSGNGPDNLSRTYEYFFDSATINLAFRNCVFDVGPVTPNGYPIFTGNGSGARITTLDYINCDFLPPSFSFDNTGSSYLQGRFVNCAFRDTNITAQPYNLLAASFDSGYNITSSGWTNTGTGTNPDGTPANIGVYGGQYGWGYLAQPPATPRNLTANATGSYQVTLTWDPNAETDLTGYIVYRDYVEIARVGPLETTYTDNSVSPNTAYTYGIRAYNTAGVSDISNAATVTTPPPPPLSTPQGLTATATAYNQVQLSWQPNAEPNLAGYIIYRDYVEIARVGPGETSYADGSINPNTTYTYGIKAYSTDNTESDMSNAVTVTTPPELSAPTGLKATATYGRVQLSWTPNTEPDLAGYIVYRNYLEIARVGPGETSYADSGVISNTTYTYGVKAYKASGAVSDMSSAATVTTPNSPNPVLTARVDGRTIRLSWTGEGESFRVVVNGKTVATVATRSYNYTAEPGNYAVQVVASIGGAEYPSNTVHVTVSTFSGPSSGSMAGDLLTNMGQVITPAGGLIALALALKASPFLLGIAKAFFLRRF